MIASFKAAGQTATVRSSSASASSLPKPRVATDTSSSENVPSVFDIEKENNINLINKKRKEAASLTNIHKRQPSDPLNSKQTTAA